MQLLKTTLLSICLLLGSIYLSQAYAASWQGPDGLWRSDTCFATDGSWFTFADRNGLVGSPCRFTLQAQPGVIHFGTFQ